MFVLYNILQWTFLLAFFPLLILFVACSSKYRNRVPSRLGFGLREKLGFNKRSSGQTIWLHALSVGEVTSAVPLVRGLRAAYPDTRIIVSTTTGSGKKLADNLLGPLADRVIDGPIDLLPVVLKFIRHIHPDLFILVETDFWPNMLLCLKNGGIPAILVNGRISEKSMTKYLRWKFFFQPMFQCLSFLSMQTLRDKEKMELLGIISEKLPILGNLKFATHIENNIQLRKEKIALLPKDRILFIAGSTHPGEEKILIDCYCHLRNIHPELFLILAPRDPKRTKEIVEAACECGLSSALRSDEVVSPADLFILDTIGELVDFYALSHLAFVGGSLVNKGGHNPVEPAAMALPVLFGPHMEDFSEIADSLIAVGGAVQTNNQEQLVEAVSKLLSNPTYRSRMGQMAQQCVRNQGDIIANHLKLIEKTL